MAALSLTASGAVLAACGSSDDSSSSSSTEKKSGGSSAQADAKAAITAGRKIPVFSLKADPVDISKAQGKTIFNIPVASTIPYVVAVDKEAANVAKTHGVKWIEYANQGTPTEWASGMNQAIQQKVDLIVLAQGIDPQALLPQLKRAKAAGIPVLITHLYQNGQGPQANVSDMVAGFVTVPFWEAARLEVDYAVAQSGCDFTPLIITSKEVPPSNGIVAAMQAQLKKRCPNATSKVVNVPVTEWGTKIRPEVQSAVTQDPKITWVLPIYDSMSIPAEAGVRAAGKSGTVKIASYNGTPAVLKLIQDGNIVVANMGENINWLGWATMDQAFRVLTNGAIIKDGKEDTPLRVFDKSNVDETGTPPTPNKGYGTSYIDGYNALWGVK